MDAVKASHLQSQMPRMIAGSFTDGMANIEEIYRMLRGDGYLPHEIRELFRLKRELQLLNGDSNPAEPFSPEVERILSEMKVLIK